MIQRRLLLLFAVVLAACYLILLGVWIGSNAAYDLSVAIGIAPDLVNPEGVVEAIEAILWLIATVFFGRTAWRTKSPWLVLLTLMCFFALGEEISWGQHLLGFEAPEALADVNQQDETNLHNLNLAVILGLPETMPFYSYFTNITRILNPLFYLVNMILWIAFPLLKPRVNLLRQYPALSRQFVIFAIGVFIVFIVVDRLLINAGELLELGLSMLGCLAAVEVFLNRE